MEPQVKVMGAPSIPSDRPTHLVVGMDSQAEQPPTVIEPRSASRNPTSLITPFPIGIKLDSVFELKSSVKQKFLYTKIRDEFKIKLVDVASTQPMLFANFLKWFSHYDRFQSGDYTLAENPRNNSKFYDIDPIGYVAHATDPTLNLNLAEARLVVAMNTRDAATVLLSTIKPDHPNGKVQEVGAKVKVIAPEGEGALYLDLSEANLNYLSTEDILYKFIKLADSPSHYVPLKGFRESDAEELFMMPRVRRGQFEQVLRLHDKIHIAHWEHTHKKVEEHLQISVAKDTATFVTLLKTVNARQGVMDHSTDIVQAIDAGKATRALRELTGLLINSMDFELEYDISFERLDITILCDCFMMLLLVPVNLISPLTRNRVLNYIDTYFISNLRHRGRQPPSTRRYSDHTKNNAPRLLQNIHEMHVSEDWELAQPFVVPLLEFMRTWADGCPPRADDHDWDPAVAAIFAQMTYGPHGATRTLPEELRVFHRVGNQPYFAFPVDRVRLDQNNRPEIQTDKSEEWLRLTRLKLIFDNMDRVRLDLPGRQAGAFRAIMRHVATRIGALQGYTDEYLQVIHRMSLTPRAHMTSCTFQGTRRLPIEFARADFISIGATVDFSSARLKTDFVSMVMPEFKTMLAIDEFSSKMQYYYDVMQAWSVSHPGYSVYRDDLKILPTVISSLYNNDPMVSMIQDVFGKFRNPIVTPLRNLVSSDFYRGKLASVYSFWMQQLNAGRLGVFDQFIFNADGQGVVTPDLEERGAIRFDAFFLPGSTPKSGFQFWNDVIQGAYNVRNYRTKKPVRVSEMWLNVEVVEDYGKPHQIEDLFPLAQELKVLTIPMMLVWADDQTRVNTRNARREPFIGASDPCIPYYFFSDPQTTNLEAFTYKMTIYHPFKIISTVDVALRPGVPL